MVEQRLSLPAKLDDALPRPIAGEVLSESAGAVVCNTFGGARGHSWGLWYCWTVLAALSASSASSPRRKARTSAEPSPARSPQSSATNDRTREVTHRARLGGSAFSKRARSTPA